MPLIQEFSSFIPKSKRLGLSFIFLSSILFQFRWYIKYVLIEKIAQLFLGLCSFKFLQDNLFQTPSVSPLSLIPFIFNYYCYKYKCLYEQIHIHLCMHFSESIFVGGMHILSRMTILHWAAIKGDHP